MGEPLFSKHDLGAVLDAQIDLVRSEILSCNEDYLLGVSEADYVKHLASRFEVTPIQLGEPFMHQPTEVDVDVSNDPMWGMSRYGNRNVKGVQVQVIIPFEGEARFFWCRPSTYNTSLPYAELRQGHLALVFKQPGQLNPDTINSSYKQTLDQLKWYVEKSQSQCRAFNAELEKRIQVVISERKGRLLQMRKAASSIGLPLQRRSDAPKTYSVPGIVRKPQFQRPTVKDEAFAPEPELAEEEYVNILMIIRSMVSVMERSPKAFIDMEEEDLRVHFLVQLNSHYQGRATGETFNYQGKTDILIREGDRNVFIAECKIWKGEAELLKAIHQLLSYLHWRDTKAALLVFNRNKSFTDVLAKIAPVIERHPCFKRLIKKTSDTEWRYLFSNLDDPNRELQLAVMLFDIPKE